MMNAKMNPQQAVRSVTLVDEVVQWLERMLLPVLRLLEGPPLLWAAAGAPVDASERAKTGGWTNGRA